EAGSEQRLDFLLLRDCGGAGWIAKFQLSRSIEQATASERGAISRRLVEIGVKNGKYPLSRRGSALQTRVQPCSPLQAAIIEIGIGELRLGGEIIVEAHFRDARARRNRVDAGGRKPVAIEKLPCRAQKFVSC